jgi:CubicO group peptidase (beta-lactamase class C family)
MAVLWHNRFGILLSVPKCFKRLLPAMLFVVGTVSETMQTSPPDEAIRRVQDGLPRAVIIRGEPVPKLAERMAELEVPGASVTVIHNGKIEWAHGFGVTRVGGPPVTTSTLFEAGSISKPVAAMAALRLVESGKLGLDADVNQYLKRWKVPDSEFTRNRKVTLRQLLTHTAGLTVGGFEGYSAGAAVPNVIQILNGMGPANTPPVVVDFQPGSRYRYSGGGYTVLQLLLEDVTSMPFPKLLQQSVLSPIGMTSSTFEQPLPRQRLNVAATPYTRDGNQYLADLTRIPNWPLPACGQRLRIWHAI